MTWPGVTRVSSEAEDEPPLPLPGCPVEVPPRLFMCRRHWFTLPLALRREIWRTYHPGQEISRTPSPEYLAAARTARAWAAQRQ
jgi:hypothetical protein